jgi:hypothetical protein
MNAEDLLYTNQFVNTTPLTQQQINENANNFIPYRTIKNQTVDNVRDNLERTYQKNNPLTQQHLRSYGWNKGNFGNERPVLSDFARDIGESSYYRYKTSYINIDSRMRDVSLYPYPNNYNMFLGRKYQNIECIKLVDYFFPEADYPINVRNNKIVFFTIPWDMILFKGEANSVDWTTIITNETILSFFVDFRLLGSEMTDCSEAQIKVRNNIYKNFFAFQIPEGNYTTTELEKEIENKWNYLQFFNSHTIIRDPYIFADGDTTTESLYNRPQLVDVSIDPETSQVSFLLRYEKLKVEYIKSYYGKNYFDLLIKTEDPLVSSQEYLDLANNEIYPVHLTDLPDLGGVKEYNINLGYLPFTQICLYSYDNISDCEANLNTLTYYNYYTIVKDPDTGNPIPNLLRFYIYNQYYEDKRFSIFEPLILSNSEKITYDDPCKLLCDARIGRDAPFFLINGNDNPLSQILLQYNNNIYNLLPAVCNNYNCDIDPPTCPDPTDPNFIECCRCQINTTEPFCKIVDTKFDIILNNLINNIDCSSRLLVNILGFFNTLNNQTTIGQSLYARGYQSNGFYKLNSYIKSISTISIASEEATKYLDCQKTLIPPPAENPIFTFTYPGSNTLNFKLPICKNGNGTYSFYFENYMFLKIMNNGTMNNTAGTEIQQIKPTSQYSNGSEDIYLYTGDSVRGFDSQICSNNYYADDVCNPIIPDGICDAQKSTTASTFQKLSKNIENIFAKIKLSTIPGACSVDNVMPNEVIFYDGSLTNMDELVIQLIDYEGKIIELTRNHSFTLMIVEKIEILKETNINTRTGFINTMGSIPVNRNSHNQ